MKDIVDRKRKGEEVDKCMSKFKKNIAYILFLLVASFLTFPAIAYIINAVLDRKLSVQDLQSNINLTYYLDLITSKDVFLSFLVVNPINVGFWGLFVFGVVMVLLTGLGPNEKDVFEHSDIYGSHGTARWQTKKEIKKHYYQDPIQGWYLGSIDKSEFKLGQVAAIHAINNSGKLNSQIIVYGPPGSNKTTALINTNIHHIPYAYKSSTEKPDIIVTDPKGEILAYTGNYLINENYDVRIIDFLNLMYGDAVNVLTYIDDYEDIIRIAKGYVSAAGSTEGVTKTGDPIWENGEALLLGALIAFVKEVYPIEEQNFDTISKIIGSPNIRDLELAETFFIRHDVSSFANELWNKFLNLEDKVRSGVVGGLSIMMTLFSIPKVKDITNLNTVDFRELGRVKDKPMAIFIQIPDEEKTFSPIVNAIISMMLKTMYRTARETNSVLPNPVYMIIEEMANIGKLYGIEEMLGTMRGRRIYPMMIWQDLLQIKKMFGDAWEGLLAKCDTQIFLGGNDQFTVKYISESLGKTTIKIQGTSSKTGGIMSSSGESQSQNRTQRSLLFPDEVKRLDSNKLIVLQRGRQPLLLNKTQYKHWIKQICKPLLLSELPLLKRIYLNNEPVAEATTKDFQDVQIADVEDVENLVNENVLQEDLVVDLETGEIVEELSLAADLNVDSISIDENEFSIDVDDIEIDSKIFDFTTIELPSSEFDRREHE